MIGEAVTVLTAGTTLDPYSNEPTADWDHPTAVPVTGVAVEPRPSSEPVQDARNAVTSGFTLYFPPGTPVTAADRVQVRGQVYDVLGEPAVWVNPYTGWVAGTVAQVTHTEG